MTSQVKKSTKTTKRNTTKRNKLPKLLGSAMSETGAKLMIKTMNRRGCIVLKEPWFDDKRGMWYWNYTDPLITE